MPSSDETYYICPIFHSPDTGDFTASIVLLIGFGNGKSSSPRAKDNLGTVFLHQRFARAPGRVRPCGAARSRARQPPGRAGRDPKSSVPEGARGILQVLIRTRNALEEQLKELHGEIARRAKADPVARRLMTIPGIGRIAATAITALVPAPEGFRAGRDFAAWLGLTPLQKSTGGKNKLGAISKRGGGPSGDC